MRLRNGAAPHPLLAFLLVGLLHSAFAAYRGPLMSADSITYSNWVEQIHPPFQERVLDPPSLSDYPRILYTGWVALLALAQSVFASHWRHAILALNAIANGAVAAMIVRRVAVDTEDPVAAWLSLGLYVVCFDLLLWTPFVLSDPTFLLINFGAFAIAARGWQSARPNRVIAAVTGLSLLALIFRPNGVLIPLSLLIALVVARVKGKRTRLAVGAVAVAMFLLFANARLVQDPSLWPGAHQPRALRYHAALYQNGVVVYGRPDTFHPKPASVLDHAAISLDRLAQFFRITHPSFSRTHNAIALLFFVPAYVLAVAAAIANRRRSSPAVTASLIFVAVTWYFTSIAQIDYDWRYRVPILPHLIFLAGVGFAHASSVFSRRMRGESTP